MSVHVSHSPLERPSPRRGTHRRMLVEVLPELVLVITAVVVAVRMPSLVSRAVMQPEKKRLYSWYASGVVEKFAQVNGSWQLSVWGNNRRWTTPGYVTVTSKALKDSPRALRVGVSFDKAHGTRRCRIDGQEYDLFPP